MPYSLWNDHCVAGPQLTVRVEATADKSIGSLALLMLIIVVSMTMAAQYTMSSK